MATMKAVVFKGKDRIAIEDAPRPHPRAGEAVIRITTTTICGTDVHIVRGEYPVKPGLILGHEPVGVIHELGAGLEDQVGVQVRHDDIPEVALYHTEQRVRLDTRS
jgi:alcohol dehydrogenase